MQIEKAAWQAEKPPSRPTRTRWRIIVRPEANSHLDPLCVCAGTSRVLLIFGFEEEAEMFLLLGGYDGSRWQARESSEGELASVLCGPCADVEGVALDPLPEMLEAGTIDLVDVERRRFVSRLLARERGQTALW